MRKTTRPPYQTLVPGDMVYLYAFECQGFFKIGIATNWRSRLSYQQVGCPFEIRKFFTRKVRHEIAHKVEQAAHDELRAFHHRGEWFRCTADQAERALYNAQRTAKAMLAPGQLTEEERAEIAALVEQKRAESVAARAKIRITDSVQIAPARTQSTVT